MNPFYTAAQQAARKAWDFLRTPPPPELFEKNTLIGAGGDRSSGLDLALERIFVDALGSFGRIDSEESGSIGEGEATIILDPLDGSSNALSRFPYYGVSIARLDGQGILREAFVANLANGDLYRLDEEGEALKGSLFESEWKRPIPSPHPEIGLFEKAYAQPEIVAALDRAGLKFRAPGAVALSLAYARNTNYFLFVGPFRIYDFAAGLALCKGMEIAVEEEYVLVSKDREVFDKIRDILKECGL
ncbi:inositol monophosphatase family protein [Nitratifractor salsuginis]|uniref:Inositol monophosphatase n=1 Tax=Nitratifractor salsuginis (strain DSM 16511 / JCM 12458 / E9I37-1) TaxID=749222 RepID=E6WZQ7_NITSE|nr:inositol monophosphatase family protein [Nitratifractor salsuginis]ADV46698.1 inositol monophosphatase [Nitratifractor salsuginis DSM 16511]